MTAADEIDQSVTGDTELGGIGQVVVLGHRGW
jgi:hypothetical protein